MPAVVDRLRHALVDGFDSSHAQEVELAQRIDPIEDRDARYGVRYEARFVPSLVDVACVEVWVTADGMVGIGFDSHDRIAGRLGVRWRGGRRFAAGHEPRGASESGLIALLDAVADGSIGIRTRVLPGLGLIGCKAFAASTTVQALENRGYPASDWIEQVDPMPAGDGTSVLRYRPWACGGR